MLVPVSATVLSAQDVRELGVTSFDKVGQTVPNLNVQRRFGPGSGPLLSLRGQDSGAISFEADNRAGLYLDEVYMGRLGAMSAFILADVCGLEVLNGPQGTMFGASATSGVIRLASCSPVDSPSGELTLGAGSQGGRKARLALNGGFAPGWSARLVLLKEAREGWARNAAPGVVTQLSEPFGTLVSAERLGQSDTEALALALRYRGTAGLTLDYRYDQTHKRDTQPPTQLLGPLRWHRRPLRPGGRYRRRATLADAAGSGGGRPAERGPPAADRPLAGGGLSLERAVAHEIHLQLAPHAGERRRQRHRRHRLQRQLPHRLRHSDARHRPCLLSVQHERQIAGPMSSEIRLLLNAGAWDWTGGLFFFRESGLSNAVSFIGARFQPGVLNEVGSLSRFVPSDYYSGREVQVANQSAAGFVPRQVRA